MRLRNQLRVSCFPNAARILHAAGISWSKLRPIFKHETFIAEVRNLAKQSSESKKSSHPLHMVMLTYFPFQVATHFLIGKALQERGHRVSVVMLDRSLPLCELTDIESHHRRHDITEYSAAFGMKYAEASGFEVVQFSSLIDEKRFQQLATEVDPRWDEYADSMLLRYFKTGNVDKEDSVVKAILDAAKHAANISSELGRRLLDLSPDRVLITHGSYTSRGPAKDVLIEAGVPVVSFQRGKLKDTEVFNWNVASDDWSVDTIWEEFIRTPFTQEKLELTEAYLQSRRDHRHDQFVFNQTGEQEVNEARSKLELKPSAPTYTLFSNVLWDAASAQKEIAFRSAKHWIFETIKYFAEHPNKNLIVRAHPAELIIGTNCPVGEMVRDEFGALPANIKIMDPNYPINSWTMLQVTDVGLVHTSTVGLEMALEGKRCICVAKTNYRNKGFTIDVKSQEEYFEALNAEIGDQPNPSIAEAAMKYAYLYFLKYHMPFPYLTPKTGTGAKYFEKHEVQDLVASPYMQQIVRQIENQEPFCSSDELTAQFHKHLVSEKYN